MRLTAIVAGNLNARHWNRRVWQIGYRGPLLAQQKATGRPDFPVSAGDVNTLRERFAREMSVMKLLTRPYVTKKVEEDFLLSKGVDSLQGIRDNTFADLEARRMPGKPKRTDGSKAAVRRRGNVGNLLHEHVTVEDSLAALANRKRWD
ncbi:unnamed protein product [Caenorhabditis auriculariae]|uniref:Uncharacterized protein n=1 Tax=Caenorhabditis auriculariae TaxID=2777116 RepID=A0A8S1GWZ8_9PELO|nr:unnamed protein product [Caenorhabditis auriculariae]